MSRWRMEVMCADCPFSKSERGTHLRKSLAPGRMAEIRRGLRQGEYFMCHKTTEETGNGSRLLCAGAIEYQESIGASSNYQRVCENLDYFEARRKEKASVNEVNPLGCVSSPAAKGQASR